MKKILSIVLAFALIVTLVPGYGQPSKVEAAGSYFLFPNEKDTKASARTVSNKNVTITGTINGVVGSSISYKVEQVTMNSDTPLNSTQDISTGITTSGSNSITISNIELFPGLNKITFKGVAGTSTVEEYIYIEYRNSPTLNDVEIVFENTNYAVVDSGVTMLYSNESVPKKTGSIVIVGKAPNASKVAIELNGKPYEFNVMGANTEYRFSTSQLTINKGMNTIKFTVTNNGQAIETTRLVNLYNGEITYFDEKIVNGSNSFDVIKNGEYSVTTGTPGADLKLTGKAVMPLPIYNINAYNAALAANNDPNVTIDIADYKFVVTTGNVALEALLEDHMSIVSSFNIDPDIDVKTIEPMALSEDSKYITVTYEVDLSGVATNYNTPITFEYRAPNLTQMNLSEERSIKLRNGTLAYIADINYLSGFDATMNTGTMTVPKENQLKALQGTDIDSNGVNVYSIPMAVELLIANHSQFNVDNLSDRIKLKVNNKDDFPYKVINGSDGKPLNEVVTQLVNGVETTFLRVFLQLDTLDKSGTNNATFSIHSNTTLPTTDPNAWESKTALFKLQYGPYVKYESIVDGMAISYDSLTHTNVDLIEKLGGLAGRIMNIANSSDISYVKNDAATPPIKQTVFLYLNNVALDIKSYSQANEPNSPLFRPDGVSLNANGTIQRDGSGKPIIDENKANEIAAYLNKAGENTLKFVFASSSYSYESTIKFSIVPTNLPTIPAEKTDGVFPYTGEWPPQANSSKFTYNNTTGVYTTKEADFNVFGTFDFVDLGTTYNDITSVVGIRDANGNELTPGKINPTDYLVTISNPNWGSREVKWDLSQQFKVVDEDRNILQANGTDMVINSNATSASTIDANITFYYDIDKESFFFDIIGQSMPEDGSPLVYVITVFNAGPGGPRATYRLEINPISIPYSIKSPVEQEYITNKNFVEFIISSPGADSVTVNKQVAKKVDFIDYNKEEETMVSWRAVVTGLSPNKDTKISFTIVRGDEKITDSITVRYAATNIPGAQVLETMKSSHKVFDNRLNLTFPKNTNLIRSEFNEVEDYATQIYTDHEILFAIANPEDGIVDRHLYDGQAPGYTANSTSIGSIFMKTRFEDLAGRYIKASPVYWIDGGLADDPDTSATDTISSGLDPFPFPNIKGKYAEDYSTRHGAYNRELIPSKVGTLTLAYDSSVVASAGTTITVFHFDPVELTWMNIGGVVDTKKGTITVPFNKFGYYVVTKLTRGYNDIIDHSYAREAMEAIYAKGVMNAVDPVSQFGGDRYVTRGEFTRMIVRALELPLNYAGSLHFTYYPETVTNASNPEATYDYRYIETAARAGIVNGTRPGFFDEDAQLTRQDAAVILARALELKLETDSTKAKAQLDKAFKDGGSFDFYAIPGVLAVQKKGFIVGKPIDSNNPKAGYMYDPKARMLRSDAAIIMARVMTDMKKLPKIYN